jgi:GNAT superfamily N-acetyltransferase
VSSYSIRAASDADQPEILALLREHTPQVDPARKWEWIYVGNPEGRALTWVAVDDASGDLAGLTSYFPVRLWVEGEIVRAAIGGDGYVRPRFRRRGIAAALHAALRAEMPKHGIEAMFGAPAAANVTPLQAGGSHLAGEQVRFVRPLTASALTASAAFADGLARCLLSPRASTGRLEAIREGDGRVDDVWAAARGTLRIAVVHDAKYYCWRFLRAPAGVQEPYVITDRGEPLGICALQEVRGRLHIVDLTAPPSNWGASLRAIAQRAARLESLEIFLLREDAARLHLWRHGFVAREARPYLVVTPEGSTRSALLSDPTRWAYSAGDLDIDRLT